MSAAKLVLIGALWLALIDASTAAAQAAEPQLLLKLESLEEKRDVARGYDGGYVALLAGAYLAAPLLGGVLGAGVHPVVGISTYVLAAPAVHIAYGNPPAAALALFGPTAAVVSSVFVVAALQRCEGFDCLNAPVIAGLIGYVAWAVVDILVHARRDRPRLPERAPSITTRVSYRR
jgi:hypothetical protein